MPTAMTFNSLKKDLQSYLEKGQTADTTVYAQLPQLINLAERGIARELKIEGFLKVVTGMMASGKAVYPKPERWRLTVSMNFGSVAPNYNNRTPIFARDYEYIRSYWPDDSAVELPEFYADYNYNSWIFAPTPSGSFPFEVIYYEQPPLLDDDNQTNWLTTYAPNALLYRSLLEASPFIKEDGRMAVWQGMYDRAVSALNGEDIQKIIDRAATRNNA